MYETDSEIVDYRDQSQWLKGRAASIGSSDCATILGHGYASTSIYSLWCEKCLGMRKEHKAAVLKMFEKGKAAEEFVVQSLRIDRDWLVRRDPPHSYRRSKQYPFLTSSLDGWMLEDQQPVVIEFKLVSDYNTADWDESENKAPLKFVLQVQHQLLVTGWQYGYLAACSSFETKVVRVDRHEGLIAQMLERYHEFWDCVVNKREPELDGSEATRQSLEKLYVPRPMEVKHLSQEETEVLDDYLAVQQHLKKQSERLDFLKNRMIQLAGCNESLVTADGRWFDFKGSRGRQLKPKKWKR